MIFHSLNMDCGPQMDGNSFDLLIKHNFYQYVRSIDWPSWIRLNITARSDDCVGLDLIRARRDGLAGHRWVFERACVRSGKPHRVCMSKVDDFDFFFRQRKHFSSNFFSVICLIFQLLAVALPLLWVLLFFFFFFFKLVFNSIFKANELMCAIFVFFDERTFSFITSNNSCGSHAVGHKLFSKSRFHYTTKILLKSASKS